MLIGFKEIAYGDEYMKFMFRQNKKQTNEGPLAFYRI